jgi:hypothetical protein
VGATDIADGPWDPEDFSGLVACRWAEMTCKAFLDERPAQRLLVIFFSQSAFLRMLPDEPGDASQEAAAPLLEAFVQACEALRPDAALVVNHPHQAHSSLRVAAASAGGEPAGAARTTTPV